MNVRLLSNVGMTDFQDKESRRRLDVVPTGPSLGKTFLVYTGSSGGGMYMGNEFRVSGAAASRHLGLMGFGTLNKAVDGQLKPDRLKDNDKNYVVEVKFNSTNLLRYHKESAARAASLRGAFL